jgi:hypothetical protein
LARFATQLNLPGKQAITLGHRWNRPPRLRLSGLTSELSFPEVLDWNRNTSGGNDIQGIDHDTIICIALSLSTDCPLFSCPIASAPGNPITQQPHSLDMCENRPGEKRAQ